MKIEGIYTPVITPYNADGSIDEGAFLALIEHLIASGVHAIVVGGSTGEYFTQSMDERIALMKAACNVVNGRLPVMAGASSMRTDDSVKYAKAAKAAGADALLLGSPPYAVPTQEENALHALAVDRAADLPIMLYNYPGRMSVTMGADYLDRVGRSKNFVAIKESSGEMSRVHMLARDYPHIQLSCGYDDQALEFFAWGARSWVCAAANFLPKECVALYKACVVEDNFKKGRRIMSALLPLMAEMDVGGKFIQCIKHMCEVDGLRAGPVRGPLRGLDKDEKRRLESVVRVLRQTIATIEAEV